jgi:hypothetical protein
MPYVSPRAWAAVAVEYCPLKVGFLRRRRGRRTPESDCSRRALIDRHCDAMSMDERITAVLPRPRIFGSVVAGLRVVSPVERFRLDRPTSFLANPSRDADLFGKVRDRTSRSPHR